MKTPQYTSKISLEPNTFEVISEDEGVCSFQLITTRNYAITCEHMYRRFSQGKIMLTYRTSSNSFSGSAANDTRGGMYFRNSRHLLFIIGMRTSPVIKISDYTGMKPVDSQYITVHQRYCTSYIYKHTTLVFRNRPKY